MSQLVLVDDLKPIRGDKIFIFLPGSILLLLFGLYFLDIKIQSPLFRAVEMFYLFSAIVTTDAFHETSRWRRMKSWMQSDLGVALGLLFAFYFISIPMAGLMLIFF